MILGSLADEFRGQLIRRLLAFEERERLEQGLELRPLLAIAVALSFVREEDRR